MRWSLSVNSFMKEGTLHSYLIEMNNGEYKLIKYYVPDNGTGTGKINENRITNEAIIDLFLSAVAIQHKIDILEKLILNKKCNSLEKELQKEEKKLKKIKEEIYQKII